MKRKRKGGERNHDCTPEGPSLPLGWAPAPCTEFFRIDLDGWDEPRLDPDRTLDGGDRAAITVAASDVVEELEFEMTVGGLVFLS